MTEQRLPIAGHPEKQYVPIYIIFHECKQLVRKSQHHTFDNTCKV